MKVQFSRLWSARLKISLRYIPLLWITMLFPLWNQHLTGQCNPPWSQPSLICEEAPLACLEGSCYETINTPFNCCNGWCGANTAIHNPQYFAFIATEENVEIHIYVDYCDNGNALQSAILDACPWDNSNVIACDPGTGPGGTMVLAASGLIPDQIYWIVVDGSSGATCGYTFTETNGIYEGFTITNLAADSTFASDTFVCPGFNDLYLETGPMDNFVQGYYWVPGWSNDTITSTLPNLTIDIPNDIPDGAWEICVTAFSGCDTSNTICIPIVITSSAPVTLGPDVFCPESFPFIWGNSIIIGPGTYTQTFNTLDGCAFDTVWMVEEYPENASGHIITSVCDKVYLYEGSTYDESGSYTLLYPGSNVNGCDSMAILDLTLEGFEFYVEAACIENEVVLVAQITDKPLSVDTFIYAWYTCSFDSLLSLSPVFQPDISGCYCLVVESSICSDTICSTYAIESCPELCDIIVPEYLCYGQEFLFEYPGVIHENDHIQWHITYPDQSDLFVSDQDSFSGTFTLPGIYRVTATLQTDSTTQTCRDRFFMEALAEIGICCDTIICDSCTFLTLHSSGPLVSFVISAGEDTLVWDGVTHTQHEVCLPPQFGITFTILNAIQGVSGCLPVITQDSSATIFRAPTPDAGIVPDGNGICALPEGMTGYAWRYCEGGGVLDFSRCFTPDTSGCYCVSILSPDGCRDTACYDFIIDNVQAPDKVNISIVPNPSTGTLNISLPEGMAFPINWSLSDAQGKQVENGVFTASDEHINLDQHYPPGMYVLKVENPAGLIKILKVMLQ